MRTFRSVWVRARNSSCVFITVDASQYFHFGECEAPNAGGLSWCRLGAVSRVDCRPGCRDMPLYAAICRSLERKSLIFLGLGFFFASQLRWRSASRAKLAREPEGESRAMSE
jgi:hypothetical protein